MKIVNYIIIILLVSCENGIKKDLINSNKKEQKIESSKERYKDQIKNSTGIENKIQKDLTTQIVKYYQDLYSVGFKIIQTKRNDGLDLTFINENSKKTDYQWAWTMFIPKDIILGDLNYDGFKDVIIDVIKGGGGTGGNIEENELFYFEKVKDKFELKNVNISKDLSNCHNGHFYPERIENNLLIGTSLCYKKTDPTCCPSISVVTKLSYKNNKFNLEVETKK